MDLIVWRHAEAQDAIDLMSDSADLARELTPRGAKQAVRMAAWLDRQLPESTKVFSSPAIRTEQTARTLARKYKIRPELLPSSEYADLLAMVQWPQLEGTVLLVGHQPNLGMLVANLLGLKQSHCSIKKGAVWWLRTRERGGVLDTVLVTVQTPEYL